MTGLTGCRCTILAVDDEPEVLSLFKRILSAENVDLLPAANGTEALAIARRTHLDLAILDVKLPDVGGFEVLRRLRKIDPGLPVIVVTSYGSPETVRTSMRLGAFDCLTKPLDRQEIRRVVSEALLTRPRVPAPSRTSSGAG